MAFSNAAFLFNQPNVVEMQETTVDAHKVLSQVDVAIDLFQFN